MNHAKTYFNLQNLQCYHKKLLPPPSKSEKGQSLTHQQRLQLSLQSSIDSSNELKCRKPFLFSKMCTDYFSYVYWY